MEVKEAPRLPPQLTLRLSAKACKNRALVLRNAQTQAELKNPRTSLTSIQKLQINKS